MTVLGPEQSESSPPRLPTYDKLELENANIRLLTLHPGTGDQAIRCSLQVASLNDSPDFEAASYVWGDAADKVAILVDDVEFNVPTSLRDLLRCLRTPTEDRILWADCVCIDQHNAKEKGHQIQLMSRIYGQARQVHAWLGYFSDDWQSQFPPGLGYRPLTESSCDLLAFSPVLSAAYLAEDIDLVLSGAIAPSEASPCPWRTSPNELLSQAIRELGRLAEGAHLYEFPVFTSTDGSADLSTLRLSPQWLTTHDCIYWLITRPWWERVWTLQEAILPEADPLLHVGEASIRLSTVLNATASYARHFMSCCRFFRFAWHGADRFLSIHTEEPLRRVLQMREIRTFLASPDLEGPSILRMCLRASSLRKTSEPGDHFFGILGLIDRKWKGWRSVFTRELHEYTSVEVFAECTALLMSISSEPLVVLRESVGSKSRVVSQKQTGPPATDESGELRPWTVSFRETTLDNMPSWIIDFTNFRRLSNWSHIYDWEEVYFQNVPEITEHIVRMHDGLQMRVRAVPIGTVDQLIPPLDIQPRKTTVYEDSAFVFWQNHVSKCWSILPESVQKQKLDPTATGHSSLFAAFWSSMNMSIDSDVVEDEERSLRGRAGMNPGRSAGHSEYQYFQHRSGKSMIDLTFENGSDTEEASLSFYTLSDMFERYAFFRVSSGLPVIGPRGTLPGDTVYSIQGCPSPAVLRPVKVKADGSPDGELFRLVGVCYVHGFMKLSTYRHGEHAGDGVELQKLTLC